MLIETRGHTLFIDGIPQPGLHGVLVRADTGERIPFAKWANTETGEWRALAATPDGKAIEMPAREVGGCCRIKFIASNAPQVSSNRQLPAVRDTPALIRAIARDTIKGYKPMIAVPGIECEEPKCHRLATWSVSYEQEIEPGTMPDGAPCERAVTVKVRKWCSWHFRPGTTVDQRGVEFEHTDIVRPQ